MTVDAPTVTNVVEPNRPQYEEKPDLETGVIKQVDWEADGADVSVHRMVERDGEVLLDVFGPLIRFLLITKLRVQAEADRFVEGLVGAATGGQFESPGGRWHLHPTVLSRTKLRPEDVFSTKKMFF